MLKYFERVAQTQDGIEITDILNKLFRSGGGRRLLGDSLKNKKKIQVFYTKLTWKIYPEMTNFHVNIFLQTQKLL